jgi:molybdate transport system substrate-binding protein
MNDKGNAAWADDWQIGLRMWVERRGQALMGKGRAELLHEIDRTHSISAAARHLRMSYRRAWLLVQEVNRAAGEPLVAAAVGGHHGGGAELTQRGRFAITVFQQLQDELLSTAASKLPRMLDVSPDARSTLHLAAAVSLQEVVGQVLTEFALARPTIPVRALFGASNELADHILAGAPADLFLTADAAHLDRLNSHKLLKRGTRRILATNGLCAVASKDAVIAVRSPQDLKRESIRRLVVADPASPLGKCSQEYLRKVGLYDALAPRLLQVDNSRAVLAAIHGGQAQAGLAFATDAARDEGCRTLFATGPSDPTVEYVAAIVTRGARADAARELLDFFTSSAADACFRRCGFERAAQARRRRKQSGGARAHTPRT